MGGFFGKNKVLVRQDSFILWDEDFPIILNSPGEFNTRASVSKRRESNAFFSFKNFSFKHIEQKSFLNEPLSSILNEIKSTNKFPMTKEELKNMFGQIKSKTIDDIGEVLNLPMNSIDDSKIQTLEFIFKNEIKIPIKVHNKSSLLGEIEHQIKTFVTNIPNLDEFKPNILKNRFTKTIQPNLILDFNLDLLEFYKLTSPNNEFQSSSALAMKEELLEEIKQTPVEIYLSFKRNLGCFIDFILSYLETLDMNFNCFSAEEFKGMQAHIISQLKFFFYIKFKTMGISEFLMKEVTIYKERIDVLTANINDKKIENPYDNHNLRNTINSTISSASKAYKLLKFDDKRLLKISFGIEKVLFKKLKSKIREFIYANTVIDHNSVVSEQVKFFLEKIILSSTPIFDVELFKQTVIQAFISKEECVSLIFSFLQLFIINSAAMMDKRHKKLSENYFTKLEKLKPIFEILLTFVHDSILSDQINETMEALDDSNLIYFLDLYKSSFKKLKRSFEKEVCMCRNLVIYLFCNVLCFLFFEEVDLDEVDLQGKMVNVLSVKIFAYTEYNSFFRAVILEMGHSLFNYHFGFSNKFLIETIESRFEKIKPNETENRLYVNYRQPLVHYIQTNKLRNLYLREKQVLRDYVIYSMSVESFKNELNVNKLFADNLFQDKFFTFKNLTKNPASDKSRHITIIIGGISEELYGTNDKNEELAAAFVGSEIYEFKYQIKSFEHLKYIEEFEALSMLGFSNLPKDYLDILKNGRSLSNFSSSSDFGQKATSSVNPNFFDKTSSFGFETDKNQWSLFCKIIGKCLAFIISNTNTFGHCVVSLVGLSFGSVVAWSCYQDLFLLGKCDKVYDIMLIGAPLCMYEMDHAALKNLNGSLYNVFSNNDWILKFISSNIPEIKLCCGNNKIKFSKSEISKKVLNLNMTKEVYNQSEYYQYAKKIVEFLRIEKSVREFDNLIQLNTHRIPDIDFNPEDIILNEQKRKSNEQNQQNSRSS